MDADAITSAAQAVHQELVRKLAEQARTQRLRDQLRRPRPGMEASRRDVSPVGGGLTGGWLNASGSLAGSGALAGNGVLAGSSGLAAGSWLLPHAASRSFVSSDPASGPGLGGPGGITGPGEPQGLRPPAAPV
jgi:hypothetical protein